MADQKKTIDWHGIEADFCKTNQPIREIARWYQISDTAIRRRAKAEEWLRPEVAAKPVRTPEPEKFIMAGVDATKPENIVGRGQNLIMRLLDELDAVTTHGTDLADMIEAHEEDPRRKAAMLKAIELPSRANVVKALATAFKTWTESNASSSPQGKKELRADAAKEAAAGGGKFAPPTAPKLVVNNK